MDHVLASKTFKPIDICRINYCRLYLQAITVSDISTTSGSRLFGGIHKGITTEITSSTTWHHIVQERPDVASWKTWNKALSLFSTNGILHTPLYEWTESWSEQRRRWLAYFDPQTGYLLTRNKKNSMPIFDQIRPMDSNLGRPKQGCRHKHIQSISGRHGTDGESPS